MTIEKLTNYPCESNKYVRSLMPPLCDMIRKINELIDAFNSKSEWTSANWKALIDRMCLIENEMIPFLGNLKSRITKIEENLSDEVCICKINEPNKFCKFPHVKPGIAGTFSPFALQPKQKEPEILPCPFCNEAADLQYDDQENSYRVYCINTECLVPRST